MLQLDRQRDLALEARDARAAREIRGQDLDDDGARERHLHGEEQPTHAAPAELAVDAVSLAEHLAQRAEKIVLHVTQEGGAENVPPISGCLLEAVASE